VQVSLTEYLKTSYRPDCEYIDGQLVERNVGLFDHSWTMGQAIFHFEQYRESLGLPSRPSLRVQVSPTRFRVPDVTVVRGDPHEQILTHPSSSSSRSFRQKTP